MSKIDELIRELCPQGVPYKPLGELALNRDSERKPVTKSGRSAGEYPYFGANGIQDYVAAYIFDGTFLLIGEDGSVANADGSPVLNWAEGKIWVNNHAHVLEELPGGPLLRYLYFYLATIDVSGFVTGGTQKKINQANLNRILVPNPPLEVQKKIVSILDKFAQLEAELEAELEARRKQLEYLSNSEIERALAEPGTRAVALSEVADVFDGVHATPAYTDSGIRFVSVEDIENLYDSRKFISEEDFSKFRKSPEIGDLLMTRIGSIGTCAVVDRDELLAYYVSLALIKPKPGIVNSEYLKILFESPIGIAALRTKSLTHAVPIKINLGDLRSLVIPVPSVSTQDKLVQKILPAQQLVKDLTIGLPAEIAARRKQYEYYRNKLLTFKELEAA